MKALESRLAAVPIMPVLTIPDGADAAGLATTLHRAGIQVAEVTLRTSQALSTITAMKQAAPDLQIGAGTVLTANDVQAACQAGADFLVSPGLSPALQGAAQTAECPFIPGIATLSEAMHAWEAGFKLQKLFPAEICGGTRLLKAMLAPLPHIGFVPTGGMNRQNLADYLALPNVVAIGGSWLATPDQIRQADWPSIMARIKKALDIARY